MHFHSMTMTSGFPAEMIKCRACGARDVEVTDRIGSDAVVSCCRCGTVLWTWPEFLSRIETLVEAEATGRAGSARLQSSGQKAG